MSTRTNSRRWRGWLAVALLSHVSLAAEPTALPELPGPAPRPTFAGDTTQANAQCATCHRVIAEEWQRSLHHHAYDNPYFLRAVALEPVNFCRKCHAPDADPERDPPARVARDGVSCLSCHHTSLGVLGVRGARAPGHVPAGDLRLGDARACGNCHEFDFPAAPGNPNPTAMQATLTEHSASRFASVPCQDCHMPWVTDDQGQRHRSHQFAVQGNLDLLKKAVAVRLVARRARSVVLELSTREIGHAFPTGDLFRSAELRVWLDGGKPDGNGVARYRLERSYKSDLVHQTRRVHKDTRLIPEGQLDATRLVELPLVSGAKTLHFALYWQRMPSDLARQLKLDPALQEHVILEGQWPAKLTAP